MSVGNHFNAIIQDHSKSILSPPDDVNDSFHIRELKSSDGSISIFVNTYLSFQYVYDTIRL